MTPDTLTRLRQGRPSTGALLLSTVLLSSILLASPAIAVPADTEKTLPPLDSGCGVNMSCPTPPRPDHCSPSSSGNPCDGAGPASIGNTSGTNQGAGNPINVITGNKYREEVDLPPLPGVLGLEIVRHYNSALSGPRTAPGMLGRGWRLSYETELFVVGRTLQIRQADGAALIFNRDPRQPSLCSSSDPAHGTLHVLASGGVDTYEWRWPNGRVLSFDARGRLLQIAAPTGEFVSLQRGAQGELLRVTDPQGRSLVFEYASPRSPGFRGVLAIAAPTGRFAYAYGDAGGADPLRLASLSAVTLPEGVLRRYHHEDARHPTLLTGISVAGETGTAASRLATYVYDDAGRAVLSVRGEPRRLDAAGRPVPGTGVGQVALDFGRAGRTVLTNSLGQTTIYTHAIVGGEYRLLAVVGAGCASCGESNVRYGYDRLGRLVERTKLDARGRPLHALRSGRDALGRVVRESRVDYANGRPLPERLVTRYAYDGPSSRPALVARPSVVPGKEHRIRFSYNDRGQPLEVTESGFSPLDTAGETATSAETATPITRTTAYAYATINARSLLVAIDGPLANGPRNDPTDSDVTRFEWDDRGRFIGAVRHPGGFYSELRHDPLSGLLRHVRDDEGQTSDFAYNARQQVVSITHHGAGWTAPRIHRIRYDGDGRPVEGEYPGEPAANWRRGWDDQGRLRWHASALGVLEQFEYDTEGRLIEHRRRSRSHEQIRLHRYDDSGRLEHASAGRPARPEGTGALPGVRMQRDDFGRIVAQRSPDMGTVLRQFDAADRLVAMRDARGNRAGYDYDPAGRILRQHIVDAGNGPSEETRWRYEGRRVLSVEHPSQRERFEHDERGLRTARIVTLPTAQGELTAVTRYAYDEAGRLVATTLPDASRVRYQRNGQDQVVAVVRNPIQTPWLRWLGPERVIARDFERDLAGLRGYTAGNGIETRYQRSRSGVLARVVHRHRKVEQVQMAHHGSAPLRLGDGPQEVVERLLGIAPARAQTPPDAASTPPASEASRLPGALGLPDDPSALLDHRYLWDVRGNLLHSRQRATGAGAQPGSRSHAYDRQGRLLASVQSQFEGGTLAERAVWRYAYDRSQRRVLSQQGVASQTELSAATRRSAFAPGSHRRIDAGTAPARYSASGQPEQLGGREFAWDARGRLVQVREHDATVARYRYDHRGLRNAATVGPHGTAATRYFMHDEQRQLLAEFDAQGRILRQYLWLADLPLAVIDTPHGRAPTVDDQGTLARIAADLGRIVRHWLGGGETLAWLHGNHLGAPELATDAHGQVRWRAEYAPFGAATVLARDDFALNLRLPGQYFDAETGLHYNRQRYYDPEQGQYLSPDPLGTPDGPNPYAYAAFNPLAWIDPDGLILFAFDGTGNTDELDWLTQNGSSLSNVVQFRNLYLDGERRYISGVGTVDRSDPARPIDPADFKLWHIPLDASTADMGANYSGPARIARMVEYFGQEADVIDDDTAMDVDIIGFSRGAAQARDFANRIAANTTNGWYRYVVKGQDAAEITKCQKVNFRFMGLFDTVLSTNWSGTSYNLGIPSQFGYVAQAVALNEHRGGTFRRLPGSTGAFPLESITGGTVPAGATRIERGFIGAHADIGGGFGANESQLAQVALAWMVTQAQSAGIKMGDSPLLRTIVANPVVHDKSDNQYCIDGPGCGPPHREDRQVRYGDGNTTTQMAMSGIGMSFNDTQNPPFISYLPAAGVDIDGNIVREPRADYVTGTVNMQAYLDWLNANGYNLNLTVTP